MTSPADSYARITRDTLGLIGRSAIRDRPKAAKLVARAALLALWQGDPAGAKEAAQALADEIAWLK